MPDLDEGVLRFVVSGLHDQGVRHAFVLGGSGQCATLCDVLLGNPHV